MFIQRRKKRFDEEGDEDLPQKNRSFKLRNAPEPLPKPRTVPIPKQPPPKPAQQGERNPMLSDQDGLDRAYASDTNLFLDGAGTLFVSGTKGHLWDKDGMRIIGISGNLYLRSF